jgi:hypothetical protein
VSTADAVAREAAWLQVATDSLPVLPAPDGPFDAVQGYWPGAKLRTKATGLYVEARTADDSRASNMRIRPQYQFTLRLIWPVRTTTPPIAETEQQNLDNAIDLVLQRIRGPIGDKTHGGAFLSVAENPRTVTVSRGDPAVTIPEDGTLTAVITYRADDYEVSG